MADGKITATLQTFRQRADCIQIRGEIVTHDGTRLMLQLLEVLRNSSDAALLNSHATAINQSKAVSLDQQVSRSSCLFVLGI